MGYQSGYNSQAVTSTPANNADIASIPDINNPTGDDTQNVTTTPIDPLAVQK